MTVLARKRIVCDKFITLKGSKQTSREHELSISQLVYGSSNFIATLINSSWLPFCYKTVIYRFL